MYKFFVWVNSSVRGPFLPAYLAGTMHWTEALTGKLTESVKLVGATINCGGGYFHPNPQPHVQSYAIATDQVGLLIDPRYQFRFPVDKQSNTTNDDSADRFLPDPQSSQACSTVFCGPKAVMWVWAASSCSQQRARAQQ